MLLRIFSCEVAVFLSLSALTWFSVLKDDVDFSGLTSLRAIEVHPRSKRVKHFRKGSLAHFNCVNQNGLLF